MEFAYNNTVHSSPEKAPFEIVEGRTKPIPLLRTHERIFAIAHIQASFEKVKETLAKKLLQRLRSNKRKLQISIEEILSSKKMIGFF